MKKILFPTDFSPAADHAFIYALKLAQKIGANITTVHCYELPTIKSNHLPVTTWSVYESMSLEEFEDYKDHIPHLRAIAEKEGMGNIPMVHVMKEGEALYNIIQLAKKEETDLIVMGTTGASGLKRVFLGSVAAEVMENAPCPVLAIPKDAVFDGTIDHVAFATEYKENEGRALEWLVNWPALRDAQIDCVHVDLWHIEGLTHKMDKFSARFAGYPNIGFKVVDDTLLEKGLTKFLNENEVDLLTMVIHKRNFLKELFNYSVTKSLAYHLGTPILAIPEMCIQHLKPVMEDRRFGLVST